MIIVVEQALLMHGRSLSLHVVKQRGVMHFCAASILFSIKQFCHSLYPPAGGSAIGAEGGAGGTGGAAGDTYTGRKLQGDKQHPPKPVKPTPTTVNVGGNGGNGGGAYNKGPVTGGNGGNGQYSPIRPVLRNIYELA